MTTAERSETPRTNALKKKWAESWKQVVGITQGADRAARHADEAAELADELERELTALRLRYTWKPMKDAPRDRRVLICYLTPGRRLDPDVGVVTDYTRADGWMEIP